MFHLRNGTSPVLFYQQIHEILIDMLTLLLQQEAYQDFFDRIEMILSPMEKQVCDLYLQGMDYRQIADYLGKTPKSIDNALQRIRGKIGKMEK